MAATSPHCQWFGINKMATLSPHSVQKQAEERIKKIKEKEAGKE